MYHPICEICVICGQIHRATISTSDFGLNQKTNNPIKTGLIISLLAIGLTSCQKTSSIASSSAVKHEVFGKMPDDEDPITNIQICEGLTLATDAQI